MIVTQRDEAVECNMRAHHGDYRFTLNARAVSFAGDAPQTTLLDFIRNRGLTGAKEGCAEGECGACAVLFVCPGESGSVYRAVNSCLVPLPAVADREVFTVEALASGGKLQEAQRAMAELGASQCGYCTPGFAISMVAEHYRPKAGSCDTHALGGNLCRCTGYRPIRDALKSLGPAPDGAFKDRLDRPAPILRPVNSATHTGRFSRPSGLAECFDLADDPAVRFVAGNTDLGIATNLRGERFTHLVSLEGIGEMRFFDETRDAIEIGAGLTLSEISERWTSAPAFFREWLPMFASLPIRNRATLGGNLATASPIGDSSPLLLALDASLRLVSKKGERVLALSDFFQGYRRTALAPCEVILSILIPKPLPELVRFYKVAKRRIDDISTVAAAIAMRRDQAGRVEMARVALGGVAAIPWRARDAERELEGTRFDQGDLERAAESLRKTLNPIGDHRGSAAYRLAMAQSLLGKFRHEALA
jgi:xanthine dehydrogenase small subunit